MKPSSGGTPNATALAVSPPGRRTGGNANVGYIVDQPCGCSGGRLHYLSGAVQAAIDVERLSTTSSTLGEDIGVAL